MRTVSWVVLLCGTFSAPDGISADGPGGPTPYRLAAFQTGRSGRGLIVRWIGQDGHDHVSSNPRHEPNDTQDIHLVLGGLDPRREVAFIDIATDTGHHWQYNPKPFMWHAHLVRKPGAKASDVWVEPLELPPGTNCHVLVRYEDGTTSAGEFRSRRFNPRLRVASAMARARWVGQDRQDLAGLGPAVGPNGMQDARIHLDQLSPKSAVKAIRIEASSGARWEFGTNPHGLNNAELVKDPKDPRQGDLYFQPDRNLSGQRVRLSIDYEKAVPDAAVVVAGRTDPALRMPGSPLPTVEEVKLTANWLGQDGSVPARPGDVHVVIGGLPVPGRVVAIEVTDSARGAWQYRADVRVAAHLDGSPGSLDVRFGADRGTADLYFTPYRETISESFSVRLIGSNGRTWHGRFPGGPSDLGRLRPKPAATRAEARPGDDLQALVDSNGTVVLAKGTYRLEHPLVLNRPVRLTSGGGSTLLFAQRPGDKPWTTAIKLRCSNTTLEGFAVRFSGPIRWDLGVTFGPAIVGMTDSTEPGYGEQKHQVAFRRLDIEAPPVEDPTRWTESPRLFRLIGAASGEIVGSRLRGGTIEFFRGPWRIVDNEYRGTPPGTFSHGFITGHETRNILIRGNRMSSPPPSGKTWRFLVLTGYSQGDLIEGNTIEGTGARDDDTIPWSNEPEIILTESYSLRYEGRVLAASDDGTILRIGQPQWTEVLPGDVVSILNGPAAGSWRRVEHVLEPTAIQLDRPVPAGTDAVSIGPGFVSQVYEGNRIDLRGGRRSDAFVLPGDHFGLRLTGNHVIGGGLAWRIYAYPTEHPGIFGWSHVPCFGTVVERNVLEDTQRGGLIGVEHNAYIKTCKGRIYMTIDLRDNVVRWTSPFLSARRRAGAAGSPPSLTIGYKPSIDPDELRVSASGNRLEAPPGHRDAASVVIHAARLNGRKVVDRKAKLSSSGKAPDVGRRDARPGGARPVR